MDKQYFLDLMRFWDNEQVAEHIIDLVEARDAEIATLTAERDVARLKVQKASLEKELAECKKRLELWREVKWIIQNEEIIGYCTDTVSKLKAKGEI